jgi:hypothetical protein
LGPPIAWLRIKQIVKQRQAEFSQVISQLRKPGKLMMTPRRSIGEPFTGGDLKKEVGTGSLYDAVFERARGLYRESGAYFAEYLASVGY